MKKSKAVEPVAEKAEAAPPPSGKKPVTIPHSLSVRQLSDLLQVSAVDVIKQLMRSGIMANINQIIDYKVAAAVASNFDYEAHLEPRATQKSAAAISEAKLLKRIEAEEHGGLRPRPPIVTVMGHVDHGKTKLLDAIRKTNVVATEAGGITQHIGAYQAEVNGQKITFLDTPGHEAFTAMRAHGAQITDVAVLVVAADDGVMPQTLEAINHARAAGVPIVIAINKIDKPEAKPDLIKQQLAEAGLLCEEWGGDNVCVPISAKANIGIPELLENILLVAEMEDLKANPNQSAEGVVVEAGLDKAKGPVATVLIQTGTLRPRNTVVVGTTWGRIRAMFNDLGKQIRKAEPSTPVKILGLDGVPEVGDSLIAVASEHQARAFIEKRQKEQQLKSSVSLDNLYAQISAGKVKELNVILKADVQGSIEPIRASLEKLGTEQVKVRIIHSGTGNVIESDIMLAMASKGLIIGFNTGIEAGAKRLADMNHMDVRLYNIIYNLVEDVEKALKGMLEPTYTEVIDGHGEVIAVFPVGKKGKVAGMRITEGKVSRGISVRVLRKGEVIHQSSVSSLKRFKEDVKEVVAGFEAGVGVQDFNDFQVGDVMEFFHMEKAGKQ
ncbi:MAG: translation initiation factor IF-2 [Chloroflexi bacterium]|nr:translation initiation factor IF-2 [Chloroflexota bacterium]